MAALLNSWDLLNDAVQVVVVGRPDTPAFAALLAEVAAAGLPNRVLTLLSAGQSLPPGHPAAGKSGPTSDEAAIAYVCRGPICAPPARDPEALRAILLAR